jgi:hypothetical protein
MRWVLIQAIHVHVRQDTSLSRFYRNGEPYHHEPYDPVKPIT